MILGWAANAIALAIMPILLLGVVNRIKSLWSGRKGQPILQTAHDLIRLFRKNPVYSTTTSWVFRAGPYILLATTVLSAAIVPLSGSGPMLSFHFDFVWFAYLWGLGRMATLLAALDTGSSFEGMGAAREATFSTLLEPVLFLVIGALSTYSGRLTLHEALLVRPSDGVSIVLWATSIFALLIVLQVEAARMPVDDPTTHLELTMIHEVMILDHSGPELAAIQWGGAIKFFLGTSIIAALLNPLAGTASIAAVCWHVVLCLLIAALTGTLESLVARLRLSLVPRYIAFGFAAGSIALFATLWRAPGAP